MFFLFILLIVLLAGTAFFSGAETALFSLSRHDLAQFRRDKRRGHQLAAQLMQRPRKLLLTLMIGNVTMNMFVFATSIAMLHRVPESIFFLAPVLGIISPVMLTLVADVVPKGVAILAGKELAAYLAPIIRIIQIGLS